MHGAKPNCGFADVRRVRTQVNYQNKNLLTGAMIVGGWEPKEGGQIYAINISGSLVRQKWLAGSTCIWGYLDSAYRWVSLSVRLFSCICSGNAVCGRRSRHLPCD